MVVKLVLHPSYLQSSKEPFNFHINRVDGTTDSAVSFGLNSFCCCRVDAMSALGDCRKAIPFTWCSARRPLELKRHCIVIAIPVSKRNLNGDVPYLLILLEIGILLSIGISTGCRRSPLTADSRCTHTSLFVVHVQLKNLTLIIGRNCVRPMSNTMGQGCMPKTSKGQC